MKTKNSKIKGLVVRQALYLDGIKRSVLITEAAAETEQGESLEEKLLYYTKTFLYPTLISCTDTDITYDEFLKLTDLEVDEWVSMAQEKNPHWFETEEPKKKK